MKSLSLLAGRTVDVYIDIVVILNNGCMLDILGEVSKAVEIKGSCVLKEAYTPKKQPSEKILKANEPSSAIKLKPDELLSSIKLWSNRPSSAAQQTHRMSSPSRKHKPDKPSSARNNKSKPLSAGKHKSNKPSSARKYKPDKPSSARHPLCNMFFCLLSLFCRKTKALCSLGQSVFIRAI